VALYTMRNECLLGFYVEAYVETVIVCWLISVLFVVFFIHWFFSAHLTLSEGAIADGYLSVRPSVSLFVTLVVHA